MHLLSVNVGVAIRFPGAANLTGIVKKPVAGAVRISALGLEGDTICATKHHGGPDQAVYVYGQADYQLWETELSRKLPPGTFGENLTVSELRSAEMNVGDRLFVGEIELQVTAPRIPCGTFARRMEDEEFSQRFVQAERPGLYCRVLREGSVRAGDVVRLERFDGPIVPVVELFRSYYRKSENEATLRWHLSAPIAERAAKHIQERLIRMR